LNVYPQFEQSELTCVC